MSTGKKLLVVLLAGIVFFGLLGVGAYLYITNAPAEYLLILTVCVAVPVLLYWIVSKRKSHY
jgi:hypothetical protein